MHDILEGAKTDRQLLKAVGVNALDINVMLNTLFDDRHFLNCKYFVRLVAFFLSCLLAFVVLGDLLAKKPATKKVE